MTDDQKSKQQLMTELSDARQRISELEKTLNEQRHMEEILKKSKERYRTIFENTGNATILIDDDTTILLANSNFEKLSGYSCQEIEGKMSWTSFIHREDLERMKQYHQMRRTGPGFAPESYEFRFINRYGEKRDIFLSVPLIYGTKESIASLVDITERKRIEEALYRYQFMVENAKQEVYLVEPDGRLAYVNRASADSLGYTVEEMLAMGVRGFDPKFGPAFYQHYLDLKSHDAPPFETIHIAKDGRKIVKEMKSIFLSINGQDYICGFGMDITARKRAEEALRQSEERYRSIFENTATANIIASEDTTILLANSNFEKLVGYSRQELEGRISWTDFVTEEYLELMKLYNMKRRTNEASSVPGSYEYKAMVRSGQIRDLMMIVSMIPGTTESIASIVDITQRKRMEDALRESQELYTKLVDTIPDVIVRIDLEGKILFVNDYAIQISGYKREEIEGQNMLTFVSPEDGERLTQNTKLMMEKRLGPIECNLIMKDGKKISFEANGDVLRNEKGKPFGIVHMLRNITERKEAEKKIRENQERLHSITMNIPGVVYQMYEKDNGEYGVSYVSERASEFFGFPIALDTVFQKFISGVHEDDRKKFLESVRKAVKEAALWDFEGRYVKPSGEIIWFNGLSRSTRFKDRSVFDGILLDITKRKQAEEKSRQSEEKFSEIFMMSPGGISITRMSDGLIIDTNLGFGDMSGWKRDEVLGRTSLEVNFWADPADRALLVEDLKSGREVLQREFQFQRKDGTLRSGIYSARSIQIEGETFILFAALDITDRRRLEEDRLKLEEQFFQSQKMESIGRLAGGVAHDFNNMLNVIIGNTEMAMGRVEPSGFVHTALQDVLQAGLRSADLTRQLLAFARKQIATPRVLDLNDTVSGMLKMLRRLIGEDINLIWIPGHELWSVKIDPSQVDQILANMMVNARDAIDKTGKIIIETSNMICDESYCLSLPDCIPGEYVILAVSDDGCGMKKEILDNIFEPFFTTKKEGQGTGLGLATVYGIIKQNNGFINVYSEPNIGSTFKIYLPRHMAENPDVANVKEEIKAQGGTETILIVEDEDVVLNICKKMLEQLGYRVLSFIKPEEAIRHAKNYKEKIDLLLTDVVMPDMNGKELLEQINSIKPGLKCLYMSGHTADVIAHKGILEEGVHFISKPFSFKDIAVKIRETLDQ